MVFKKKLILGTANFQNKYGILNNIVEKKKITKILIKAYKNKIKNLDISDDYYKFKNEDIKFLNKFNIYKKINLRDIVFNKIKLTLFIKKLDYEICSKKLNFHGITIRQPQYFFKSSGKKLYDYLINLKKKKKIKKIGISIYNENNLKLLIKKINIDYIELPLNIFNIELFKKVKKIINKKKIKIHVRSIFLQGILLLDKNKIPKKLKMLKPYLAKLYNYVESNNLKRFDVLINFVLQYNPDKILIGINNVKHFVDLKKVKKIKKIIPYFYVKEKKLIDPRFWLKLKLN